MDGYNFVLVAGDMEKITCSFVSVMVVSAPVHRIFKVVRIMPTIL